MRLDRLFCVWMALLAACPAFGASELEEETAGFDRWFVGAAGEMFLPQGGSNLRRLGGAAVRGGYYLTENLALEGEAAWLEDAAGLGLQVLGHWQGWSFYGDLFGYSRFDPFFTIGVCGLVGCARGQVGPKAGVGALYHLTDTWALRADAAVVLGLDGGAEADFAFAVGVQHSF